MKVTITKLSELAKPMIHMNGTSKESINKDLERVYTALSAAYEALKQCCPHGRDYYTYNDNSSTYEKALAEHRERQKAIDAIKDEIEALIVH